MGIHAGQLYTDSSNVVHLYSYDGGGIAFHAFGNGATPSNDMFIRQGGNVGIGTTTPGYPLTVNGAVRAKEVIIDTGWSDYVFEKSYRLAPLSEVEQRINEDHHLPGIPSAQEVSEKGISVGQMQAKLLAKIEELTLHQIEQEKQMHGITEENRALEAKSAALEARLEAVETKAP